MAVLLSLEKAAQVLGGISIWTLRKHVGRGNVKVTHLGRRVFLNEEEVERIRQDGLPSLGQFHTSDHKSEADQGSQI